MNSGFKQGFRFKLLGVRGFVGNFWFKGYRAMVEGGHRPSRRGTGLVNNMVVEATKAKFESSGGAKPKDEKCVMKI